MLPRRRPYGQETSGFSATVEVDREDYGLVWNVVLDSGGFLVGKKVLSETAGETIRQGRPAAAGGAGTEVGTMVAETDDGEQVPPQFQDFATRHGLPAIYSLWGLALAVSGWALFAAALLFSGGDTDPGLVASVIAVVGLVMSAVLRRRKRRADRLRHEAYLRLRAGRTDRAGLGDES
ncbi:hypothetical protein [Solwaraspora sp. WMMD791]|uniref:hypothetical protein n=1 Tax=Solwaraspora sp. WMMD791 TaxID=3016086 RepID=UPI0032B57419